MFGALGVDLFFEFGLLGFEDADFAFELGDFAVFGVFEAGEFALCGVFGACEFFL